MFRLSTFLRRMSTQAANVPDVDIDPSGVYKYILVKLVTCSKEGEKVKNIVRGYADCQYHTNIFDKVNEQLKKMEEEGVLGQWKAEVLGGGKINHNQEQKCINVFGESTGYGKADHSVTVGILKTAYKDYEITSDEQKK